MTHVTNDKPPRPTLPSSTLALLLAAALAGTISKPAAAQAAGTAETIHITVAPAQLQDDRSLTRIRRQIASAARSVCDPGGLASTYRNGARRCREQALAHAERQLEARIATRPAAAGTR